ncbi:hypothetical protein AMELA_G00169000 [Ameiurus melas]|uniref:Uncharacterized protein n=1 Tax=Ameiurus melas TaxID=219545 RepID=A0A7J6ABV9_AMEME|nr:hypothetical protein AMELA_G00169000 [Ameiurus melas]
MFLLRQSKTKTKPRSFRVWCSRTSCGSGSTVLLFSTSFCSSGTENPQETFSKPELNAPDQNDVKQSLA